jgi:hypothetical protein
VSTASTKWSVTSNCGLWRSVGVADQDIRMKRNSGMGSGKRRILSEATSRLKAVSKAALKASIRETTTSESAELPTQRRCVRVAPRLIPSVVSLFARARRQRVPGRK